MSREDYLYCYSCLHEFGEDEIIYQIGNSNLCQKCFVENVFEVHNTALDGGLRLYVQVKGYAMMDDKEYDK